MAKFIHSVLMAVFIASMFLFMLFLALAAILKWNLYFAVFCGSAMTASVSLLLLFEAFSRQNVQPSQDNAKSTAFPARLVSLGTGLLFAAVSFVFIRAMILGQSEFTGIQFVVFLGYCLFAVALMAFGGWRMSLNSPQKTS